MRWMKHLTTASDDEAMAALIDEFGPAGYGVFWIILEKIALQMDEADRCKARYSIKKWSSFAQISPKKFQNIVEFLSNPENFPSKNPVFSAKKDGAFLSIECRKLLKFRDEYTRKKSGKSGQCPDNVRTNSGQTPEQETDTETETDLTTSFPNGKESAKADLPAAEPPGPPPQSTRSDQAQGRGRAQPCPHLEIVAAYNEILGGTGMPMVKPKLWKGTRRQHLAARWREDNERQNIAWWRSYFETVRGSPFLTGQNNRGWRADLGWLVKPGNMAKVLEGAYRQDIAPSTGGMPQPRTMNDIRTLQLDAMATYLLEEREKERENGGQSDHSAGDESRCLLGHPVPGDEVLATATEAHCQGVPRRPH